jgi:tetratricopeptide (TPR) repeat protein
MRYCLAILLLTGLCARADWIYLKSGRTLQGEVISQDERFIVVRVLSGEIKLRTEDVISIDRQTPQDYKFDVGRQLLQQRRYDRAVQVFEEGYLADKNGSLAKRKLALGYAEAAQYYKEHHRLGDARDICEKWIKLDPEGKNAELLGDDARRLLQQVAAEEKTLNDAISRAHTFAQDSDWNGAIVAYEHAIDLTPDARRLVSSEIAHCYVSRAGEHARRKMAFEAASDIEAALSFDPSLADKLEQFYVACALPGILESIARGNVAGAQTNIKRVLGFVPANKAVLYVAGRIEEAGGHLPAAAEQYSRALKMHAASPTSAYVDSLRKRIEAELGIKGDSWKLDSNLADSSAFANASEGPAQIKETENFRIAHHNLALAEKVADAAEFFRADIMSKLGLSPQWHGKVRIILHRTQAEYTARTAQPEWTGGCSKFSYEGGRMLDAQIHSWQTSPRLLKSVLPHEITHLIVNSSMSDQTAMPRCLHEGFAVMMEPTFRQEYFMNFLRLRIKSRDFIPLSDLISSRDYPRDPEFFYAEGYALANFLVQDKGLNNAMMLIKNASSNAKAESELLRVSGRKSLDDLQVEWLEWIAKQTKPN